MQDILFNPANEWHDYKGCRLQRSQAVFVTRHGFLFTDHTCVEEVHLIDIDGEEDGHHSATSQSNNFDKDATTHNMAVGYIILSKRTTLAVFRTILPDTARFFFLSPSLLRLLRQRHHITPPWCGDVMLAMNTEDRTSPVADVKKKPSAAYRRPIGVKRINKRLAGCLQQMSAGYYTGLACLVLFDARGPVESCSTWGPMYTSLTICFTVLLLSLKFLPTILHRPQQLVNVLCDDVLCITAHAACIALITDPCLRHGCALHSACFILQQRFMGRMPSLTTTTVVHTTIILLLLSAYVYGPRISDVRQFMLGAVCPHALEIFAQLLAHAHRMAVLSWCADQ